MALSNLVTFIGQYFGQASRNLGGDLHFSGFEPAVAHAQAVGQAIVQGFPVAQAARSQKQGDQGASEQFWGMLAHQSASCCIHVRV
ncbi:hypothetical protein D3C78_1185420 [compost metagenome]